MARMRPPRVVLLVVLAGLACGPVSAFDHQPSGPDSEAPVALEGSAPSVPSLPPTAGARVAAKVPAAGTPPWSKGIQPISRESYWHAVECGKQGGENPPCVFYDTGFCQNEEYTLALYTPYKMVAYAVWQAVRQKKEPPTPSYQEAQRTRVVLGIRPLKAANPLTGVSLTRGGRAVPPASQTLDAGGATVIYDFAAFAPTSGLTLELTGRAKTVTCTVSTAVLKRLR